MNGLSSFGLAQLLAAVAQNAESALRQVDVAAQQLANAKTSFTEEVASPKSGAKASRVSLGALNQFGQGVDAF